MNENTAGRPRAGVLHVVEELRRCPTWRRFHEDEYAIREGITRIYENIARLDTEVIREAIEVYLSDSSLTPFGRVDAEAKVFAMLRVVFDVPAGFVEPGRHYASWGTPRRNGLANMLWPYTSSDEDSELILVGTSQRYLGPPYNALAELDEFAERFGRRFP